MEKEKLRDIVKKAVQKSWHIGNAFDPIEDQTESITEALHEAFSMSGVVGSVCSHEYIIKKDFNDPWGTCGNCGKLVSTN